MWALAVVLPANGTVPNLPFLLSLVRNDLWSLRSDQTFSGAHYINQGEHLVPILVNLEEVWGKVRGKAEGKGLVHWGITLCQQRLTLIHDTNILKFPPMSLATLNEALLGVFLAKGQHFAEKFGDTYAIVGTQLNELLLLILRRRFLSLCATILQMSCPYIGGSGDVSKDPEAQLGASAASHLRAFLRDVDSLHPDCSSCFSELAACRQEVALAGRGHCGLQARRVAACEQVRAASYQHMLVACGDEAERDLVQGANPARLRRLYERRMLALKNSYVACVESSPQEPTSPDDARALHRRCAAPLVELLQCARRASSSFAQQQASAAQ